MVDATISVTPTTAGQVVVALYENGVQVQGAIAYGTTAVLGEYVTLPITATIRKMCCDSADSLTVVLIDGAGEVNNISVRVQKA